MPLRHRAEVFQVIGQAPRQRSVIADHVVVGRGGDEGDDHRDVRFEKSDMRNTLWSYDLLTKNMNHSMDFFRLTQYLFA